MAYQRFLVDTDYLPVLTEEHMKQLVRNVHDRIPLAEQSAEMNMLEYLDQFYEIENELKKGKSIREYSPLVTYPAGVYIKYEEKIYKTLTAINGRKLPSKTEYWEELVDLTSVDLDIIGKYSQLKSYVVGNMVKYGEEVFICKAPNGPDFNSVKIPGIKVWTEVETTEWEEFVDYKLNDVVTYDGNFYMLLSVPESTEDDESTESTESDEPQEPVAPDEDDCWGLIGEYSEEYEYDFSSETTDYVVHEGTVYKAIINPNATKPELGVNIVADDPRNLNVITHMVRLSVYYLHQLISPTNISETRRIAYEDSMNWLMMASRFKLNPQIPRKINREDGRATTDWAIETFQREFDPNNNPWLI